VIAPIGPAFGTSLTETINGLAHHEVLREMIRGIEEEGVLELLSQASNLILGIYHTIGRNAAKYSKGEPPVPVPTIIDNMARLKHIVKTTLMHREETEQVIPNIDPKELGIKFL